MHRGLSHSLIAAGLAVLAAACANSSAQAPATDTLLVQAGFVRRNADTPERVAAIRALPPHRFVMRSAQGSVKYLYADPTACGCIYVGGQRAYDRYRQMMASRVEDAQIRAVLSSTALPGEAGL